MSPCKYKKFGNPAFCQIINGECQFLNAPYDSECSILGAYPDYDKYWLESNADKNGVVRLDNIEANETHTNLDMDISEDPLKQD